MSHKPVLLYEVVDAFSYLNNIRSGYFVDGTFGNGGHSISIVQKYKMQTKKHKIIGIDKDQNALVLAENSVRQAEMYDSFILIHDDFRNIAKILTNKNIKCINGALLDLGVSSMQFDEKERGFSFSDPDQLLDMRMNRDQKLNATTILNYYSEKQIEKILKEYGEERFAKHIARKIILVRKNHRFETVRDLLHVLKESIPIKIQKTSRLHYATKTFQALRIEVNDELEFLGKALEDFIDLLAPGSRLAVISFHSLEDRIVKNTFRGLARACICPKESPICNCQHKPTIKIITRHPIKPSDKEIISNPRSRSAKLRIVEKLVK